jgi:DNA-binding XRE family transcriptional regulator
VNKARIKNLRDAGWSVGDAKKFLGLSAAEAAIIEMKVSLATGLRRRRIARGLSQSALAARIGSSQSRVAKMEAGDPSVSIELLVRSLLATGTRKREIAQLLVA